MVDREDIVFATCYQLAQLIAADWETCPPAVSQAISMLKPIDEPGEVLWGTSPASNLLQLTPSETEPKSLRDDKKLVELRVVTQCLRTIMKHSDAWETEDSDVIKKEVVARIANYEKEVKNLITPMFEACHITV